MATIINAGLVYSGSKLLGIRATIFGIINDQAQSAADTVIFHQYCSY